MSALAAFSSVKLPGSLIFQARKAAQPMNRLVDSQIEYWATLGQVVEHSGLTVQETQATSLATKLSCAIKNVLKPR
ncbi:MAG: hypothetical protein IPG42_11435 [Betaproteobacteria bacterium]|nr:hypothetical protein [Betaproteobacteria bacterium]MBP7780474.1 hypothetical protein [Burkholderiaceae bacterium]